MAEIVSGLWQVSDRGLTKGPYTASMLQQRVDSGQISPSALVWKDGMPAWQPLPLHFRIPTGAPAPHPLHALAPAVPDRKLVRWLCLAVMAVTFAVSYAGLIDTDTATPAAFAAIRLAIVVVIAAAGTGAALLWWRAAKIAERAGSSRSWWKVLTVTGSVAVAAILLVMLANLPFAYRLQVARAGYRDFTLETDAASGTIRMDGIIGPGFARQLGAALKTTPGINTIEIDSIGGLVDEALTAARDIERHGGLTVAAGTTCNSACLIVFMSGEKRIAPLDLVFGFHATAPITTIKGVYRLEELAKGGEAADRYLISRGVPAAFVKGARSLGPSKLYQVSAVRMAQAGAVTQLTDDGEPVTLAEGEWRAVMHDLKHARILKEEMDFFLLVDHVAPATAQSFAAKILDRADRNDTDGVLTLMREMVGAMTDKALPAAGDAALAESAGVLGTELQYVQSRERWDVCTGLLAGKGFGDLKIPPELIALDFRASSDLVASAAQRGWVKQELSAQAGAEGRALAKTIAAQMAKNGEDVHQFDKDPKIACAWTANLMSGISARPAPEAARIYRWLLAQK
ncbi:MAG: GYF domain-containing protein [Pseudomonadota bacterium]